MAEKDGKAFYLLRDGTLTDIRAEGGYEPESRIWFSGPLGAEDPDSCFWTGIYPFRTIGKPGISASLSWEGPRGQPVVAAYDILLDDFFSAVQGLAPTPESEAFVFLADGTLYVPGNEELSLSRSIASDKEDLARQGLGVWKKQFLGDTGSDVRVAATRFGGRAWWCGFVPLARANRSVWMCVMVPNSDLMADVIDQRLIFAGTGLILIIAFSSVYLIFARRSPEPQFANTVSADQIRALIDKGENQAIEFKSTMRMNLHSKKPGREIEVAWLKGVAAFLNTNGGTLLLGVTDAGDVTGLEQDVFENDDKCRLHFKNLIAKALGADLSKFIRFRLVPLDDKTIGVVECIKASRPVYLRDGNKETFYIRNGPSSDELPASRMVDYIAEHWK